MVVDGLNRRPTTCVARFSAMDIIYEYKREDVADRHLVVVLARLTISQTIADHIRQTEAVDHPSNDLHRELIPDW